MIYKYYNFPNNKIVVNGCLKRSLSYFGIDFNLKPTLENLFLTLKKNNIKYQILPFNDDEVKTGKGLLLFKDDNFSHVGVFENNVYYDSYNHQILPNYIIIFLG